jgi:hypothetical protein
MALERDEQGRAILRLDGSMGLGNLCKLTIICSDKVHGTREETFEFPYTLIDFATLQKAVDVNYILGFRVEKVIPADEQPLVFKMGEPSGGL